MKEIYPIIDPESEEDKARIKSEAGRAVGHYKVPESYVSIIEDYCLQLPYTPDQVAPNFPSRL